jgi:hypothetical protein
MSPTIFSHLVFRGSTECGPLILHDLISVAEDNESAMKPKQA